MGKKMTHLHNKDHLSSFPYEDIPKTVKMKLITFEHCLLAMHIMFFAHHVCPSHSPKRSGFEIYQGFFGKELMTFWL